MLRSSSLLPPIYHHSFSGVCVRHPVIPVSHNEDEVDLTMKKKQPTAIRTVLDNYFLLVLCDLKLHIKGGGGIRLALCS